MSPHGLLILGLGLGVFGCLLMFALGLCRLAQAGDAGLLGGGEGMVLPVGATAPTSHMPPSSPSGYVLVYHGDRYPCRDLAEAIEVTRTLAAIQRLPEHAA